MSERAPIGFRPLAPGEIREEVFHRGVESPRPAWAIRLDEMARALEAEGAGGPTAVLVDAERGIAYAPPGCRTISFTAPAVDARRIGKPKRRWRA